MKQALFFTMLMTLILGTFSLSSAQNGNGNGKITGKVLTEDGEPSAFATVILYGAQDTVMAKANSTDLDGTFELIGVGKGSYFLEVTYIGFAPYRSDIFNYESNRPMALPDVILRVAAEQLREVLVVSTRPIVEVHPDKTVFNVEGSINATGNTALELLRKSPGVVVDNNDNIMLAGKSGVRIYIDGRPSPLSGNDLADFLKNLQSNEVDAIEIITNPSARYDAEGNAGIINIRLIKDRSLGANGSVNLGFRYGETPKYNTSASLNYRNKDLNTFGSYSLFHGDHTNRMHFFRELLGQSYEQSSVMQGGGTTHSFRAGTDFFLDKKNTLGFLVSGSVNDRENRGLTTTQIGSLGGNPVERILTASNDIIAERNSLNFNANYMYRAADGAVLNIDADYGRFRNRSDSWQPNVYTDPASHEIIDRNDFASNTPTDIDIYTAKVDYEDKFLGGKITAGAKSSLVKTDNTFSFFNVIDGDRQINPDRSNNFVFEENINAAYASFQRPFNSKWNLMLGLRVENTNSTGTLTSNKPTDDDIVKRGYTDVFPSGGLTYQSGPKHMWRINYSRRIDRPNYQDLNPFEWQLDELSYMKGNAFLRPQYSNVYSIGHTFNYRLNTTLSYTHVNDVFTRITQALDTTTSNASILTFVNLAKRTNLSLTVSYPFDITKWWSFYGSATGYRQQNIAELEEDKIDITAHVANFYAQNTFLLPKGFKLELSGWYNSPSIWEGNWTTDAMYSIDIGVQKKLFNDAATLRVAVSDIFNTQKWSGESNFGALRMSGGGNWESRQIRINFSYLFGNKQVKSARQRSTGQEEEQKRISQE